MRALLLSLALGANVVAVPLARAQEGFGLVEEVVDEATKKAEASYRAGIRATKLGKNAEAIQHFEKALPKKHDSPDLFYNLVQVSKLEKKWEKVALYGQSFLLLEPDGKDSGGIQRDVDAAFEALAKRNKPAVEVTLVVPAGARGFIDDAPVATAERARVKLVAGSYQVRVDKLEHEPFTQPLTVTDSPVSITAQLTAIVYKGKVVISSKPEAGVEVFLDDQSLGKTPLQPLELPTGKKMLFRFQLAGYATWVRSVQLQKGETVTLSPVLEKE